MLEQILMAGVALSLGFAPAPIFREPKPSQLLAAMQGTWEMTGRHKGGTRIFVRIQKNTWMYVFVTGDVESKGTPSTIVMGNRLGHATIDLKLSTDNSNVLRAILRVEGDRLTVCHAPKTGERPTGFERGGKGVETMTFAKVRR